ncbi:hypothetical protein [Picosynechococcus sp. NKBG15041c]|uniref:hypothetical protein n=1 Tax=Picosynechococcus sp. NKBG15041c TaxID=1407650 RepID=UPI000420D46D|nr:hypothetical protein [Picosynechococcus sp. NKBG15041c]
MVIVYVVLGFFLVVMLVSILGDQGKRPGPLSGPKQPGSDGAIQQAIASGRKIEAIKLYRQKYNVGLKEAKEAIEQMARDA